MSRAGSGRSLVRMQPAELAIMQSAASHRAARSRPGMAAGRPSTATPGNLSLTTALRRTKCPASDAARTATDRFAGHVWGDCLRDVHRGDASLGNLIAILAGGS